MLEPHITDTARIHDRMGLREGRTNPIGCGKEPMGGEGLTHPRRIPSPHSIAAFHRRIPSPHSIASSMPGGAM